MFDIPCTILYDAHLCIVSLIVGFISAASRASGGCLVWLTSGYIALTGKRKHTSWIWIHHPCVHWPRRTPINWISNLDFPAFCGQFCPRRGFRGWISGTAVPKPSILSAAATPRTPSHFHTVKSDALHGVRCFQQEHCAAAVPSTRLCSLTAKLSNKCTPVVNWKLLGVISYMALSRSTMHKDRSISVQFLVQCIILIIQWIIHIIVYNSAQCIMQLHEVRPLRINLASDYIANSLRQELIVLENCFERKWEKI